MPEEVKDKNQEYYELGYKASQEGNYELAIEYYKKAIEVMPNDADSYNSIGNNLSRMGQFEESLKYFDKCIELFPKHDKAHKNKAMSYMDMEMNHFAKRELEQHLKLHKNDSNAYTLLGIIEAEEENYDKAINYFTKAIKIQTGLTNFELAKNYELRASVYKMKGDYKKAEKDKEQAASLQGDT